MHEQQQAVCSRRPAVAFSLAVFIHSAASKDAKFFSAVARMIDTVLVYNMRYLDSVEDRPHQLLSSRRQATNLHLINSPAPC
jgi:hypothetical protein